MSRAHRIVEAAIVQARPIPFDIAAGVTAAAAHAAAAIDAGARLIAFGETFLGGYPIWLDEAPNAALWDHPGVKSLHAIMLDQAIVEGDKRLAPLQSLCDKAGAVIAIGAHERVRGSLYNTLFILSAQAPARVHRKLVPTHGERLIWARGDGSTLAVAETTAGRIGGLICWEHWMPLARAAMHHQDEAIHIAQWPSVREAYLLASRHYAFEGRCFVLAAGTVLWREDLLDGLERVGGDAAAAEMLATLPSGQLQYGGSAVIGPDAGVLAQAGASEQVLRASLEEAARLRELAALDTDGHYARPDVFELRVDTRARPGVMLETETNRDFDGREVRSSAPQQRE
jgi:predicted amidohydrolase